MTSCSLTVEFPTCGRAQLVKECQGEGEPHLQIQRAGVGSTPSELTTYPDQSLPANGESWGELNAEGDQTFTLWGEGVAAGTSLGPSHNLAPPAALDVARGHSLTTPLPFRPPPRCVLPTAAGATIRLGLALAASSYRPQHFPLLCLQSPLPDRPLRLGSAHGPALLARPAAGLQPARPPGSGFRASLQAVREVGGSVPAS